MSIPNIILDVDTYTNTTQLHQKDINTLLKAVSHGVSLCVHVSVSMCCLFSD